MINRNVIRLKKIIFLTTIFWATNSNSQIDSKKEITKKDSSNKMKLIELKSKKPKWKLYKNTRATKPRKRFDSYPPEYSDPNKKRT